MAVLIKYNGKYLTQEQYNKMKKAEEIMDKRDRMLRDLANDWKSGEVGSDS